MDRSSQIRLQRGLQCLTQTITHARPVGRVTKGTKINVQCRHTNIGTLIRRVSNHRINRAQKLLPDRKQQTIR